MKVLVIPEDTPKDKYLLGPIISAMLTHLGRPHAKVKICQERLEGIGEALKWERIKNILDRYPMIDLYLHIVDRDGVEGRRQQLDRIEANSRKELASDKFFFSENAWQEIEVWVLAGHDLPQGWKWEKIRNEPNSKEVYFEPFAIARGLADEPGQGRKTLAQEAASHYRRIRKLCKEDVASLEKRIQKKLEAPAS